MNRLLAVVLAFCGCGVQTSAGVRTVRVRPMQQAITANGLMLKRALSTRTSWWPAGSTRKDPIAETRDGFQLFEVPPGPALIEFSGNHFVYSSASELQPCLSYVADGQGVDDAGVELELTLSQPAVVGDQLDLASEVKGWQPRLLAEPPPGEAALSGRLPWRGQEVLTGNVWVGHRVQAPAVGDFQRTTLVAILDAGVFDQRSDQTVTLRGTLQPVARAADVSVEWDGTSFETDGNVGLTQLVALRDGLPLASLSTTARPLTSAPLAMPALTPDSLWVGGQLEFPLFGGGPFRTLFLWRAPWTAAMKAPHGPPRDLLISEDGWSVSWTPPEIAPALYELQIFERHDNRQLERIALIYTDETTLPIPSNFRVRNMFVQVTAISGAGLSVGTCLALESLDAWVRFPAVSTLWPR